MLGNILRRGKTNMTAAIASALTDRVMVNGDLGTKTRGLCVVMQSMEFEVLPTVSSARRLRNKG